MARAPFLAIAWLLASEVWADSRFASHPPPRPLAIPSTRALPSGPIRFVDSVKGNDSNAGTEAAPWKSLAHAISQIRPGDTLSLRGGTYFEHVTVSCRGTAEKPITIRSHPGELAILNGGLREFVESPQTAWEAVPDGAPGEYRSTKAYPDLGGTPDGCNVLGNFADSMVPLQGYRNLVDLRDPSMAWDVEGKVDGSEGVYCGPGIHFSPETGRIHARLAHTTLRALGDDNYRGQTDPRKLPLVVAGLKAGPTLAVKDAAWVAIQDLMVCGARTATVDVRDSSDLTFDGLTVYGGYTAFGVQGTRRLRVHHTACRGIAAPWTFRGHLKYRSTEARIFSAGGWTPTGRDSEEFELAYCEFTDCVDGVFIGNVRRVLFHHNLLDNVSDDGMFLTSGTDCEGKTHGGGHVISQNLLSRCLTTFAFGVGHGRQKMTPTGRQTGADVMICRNVFDLRRPVHYQLPAEDAEEVATHGRVAGDHGSPLWEPMTIYHNTIVEDLPLSRQYYLSDLAGHIGGGGRRKLFNNIAVQARGTPGRELPAVVLPDAPSKPAAPKKADPLADLLDAPEKNPGERPSEDSNLKTAGKTAPAAKPPASLPIDFRADGNLHWGFAGDFSGLLNAFRQSEAFAASRKLDPSGWAARDVVADPKFAAWSAAWRDGIDLRPNPGSPAIDAGVALPADWPDPIREMDSGKPDIGAIPAGVEPWRIGVRGRLTIFGAASSATEIPTVARARFESRDDAAPRPPRRPAALVRGYPAFDAELVEFALAKHGVPVDHYDRVWLDTANYGKYGLVVIVGDLARARMTPSQYSEADLERVRTYLEEGGVLLVMRAGQQAFASQHGRLGLARWIGGSRPRPNATFSLRRPNHPWLAHLDPNLERGWLNPRNALPMLPSKGETLIGTDDGGTATLLRTPVGKGTFIYLGWEIADSLPHGREPSTPEKEREFEEQVGVLTRIIQETGDEPAVAEVPSWARWESTIRAFEADDLQRPPRPGGVLFLGSSSIRLWDLGKAFPGAAAVNRGFGGSQIDDSVRFADRIVAPHRPRLIVFYAGDNDVAGGKPAERVLADFRALAAGIHSRLPETRIAFLAIKPSPSRWKWIEEQRRANELIAGLARSDPRIEFVDVANPMLDAEGRPRPELFQKDNLHLNAEGYRLWNEIVRPLLRAAEE